MESGNLFRQNQISLLTEPVPILSRGSVEMTPESKQFDTVCSKDLCAEVVKVHGTV